MVHGPYEIVCDRAGFRRKKIFSPNIGNMEQKWAKNSAFLSFLKNFLSNVYCIGSVMKICIICFVPVQIPYLGKILL